MTTKSACYEWSKRFIDLTIAIGTLIVSLPAQVLIAAVIWRRLGRPILFMQERPGIDGRNFTLVKFRTMRPGDPGRSNTDEQRLTKIGKLLRSTSLDELPSLWNVIRGDMSLVGPRPLLQSYLSLYDDRQVQRHLVRPGITGLAQISGRNSLDWVTHLEMDVRYVETRSLLLDFRILLQTIVTVLRRDDITEPGHATRSPFEGKPKQRAVDE